MSKCILVINPGSTSTTIAVFRGEEKVFDETLRHSREELAPFHPVLLAESCADLAAQILD